MLDFATERLSFCWDGVPVTSLGRRHEETEMHDAGRLFKPGVVELAAECRTI